MVSTPVNVCQMGINYVKQVSSNKRCAPKGCLITTPFWCLCYVNELSELLNKSGIGGNLSGTIINHMLYADDICIVSLSSSGLQHLLNICSNYCERHDLTFNAKKSMCMYFSTSINKHCGLPVIYLRNCECQFVN